MRIRNREMIARVSQHAEVIELTLSNRLGIIRSFMTNAIARPRWPAYPVAAELIINDLLTKLRGLKREPTVVHAETTPMGAAAKAYLNETGIPYILDLHGLWSQEHPSKSGRQTSRSSAGLERLEMETARSAERVIVVSGRMKQYVESTYGVQENRIQVVPNGGFLSSSIAQYSDHPRLIYAGIFAYWERCEDFIRMARSPECNSSEFVMLGDGPTKRTVLKELRRVPEGRISFMGQKNREDSLRVLTECQIGIAPSSNDLAREVAWPVKVMDYMSCGLPVIAPRIGDWGRMIERVDAGVVTNHSDPDEFCEAAASLASEADWMRASKNALAAIETELNWDTVLEPIDRIYEEVL